jgi:hypothetical protein
MTISPIVIIISCIRITISCVLISASCLLMTRGFANDHQTHAALSRKERDVISPFAWPWTFRVTFHSGEESFTQMIGDCSPPQLCPQAGLSFQREKPIVQTAGDPTGMKPLAYRDETN